LAQKWLAWCANEGLDVSSELTVWQFVPFMGLRVGGLWQRQSAHSSQNRSNKNNKQSTGDQFVVARDRLRAMAMSAIF
jgi:hypothetical protein